MALFLEILDTLLGGFRRWRISLPGGMAFGLAYWIHHVKPDDWWLGLFTGPFVVLSMMGGWLWQKSVEQEEEMANGDENS